MITPLIFSRNRPAQLDLLLRSLEVNGWMLGNATVLYHASGRGFAEGYAICAERHPASVFLREVGFEMMVARRVFSALDRAEFFMCLCDDDVLYRDLSCFAANPSRVLRACEDVLCFSLRLGLNAQFCYPMQRRQDIPAVGPIGDAIQWNWRSAALDWAYPASLDGHVFRRTDIEEALTGRGFDSPNTLEDALVAGLRDSPRPMMASYFLSCLVGVPLNRTATTHAGNRVANIPGCTPEEMNARYLAGERLSLAMIDPWAVDGAHCEFAPVWEPRESSAQIRRKNRGEIEVPAK